MIKYRYHVHHLETDNHFFSDLFEASDEEIKNSYIFITTVITRGSYMQLTGDNKEIFIPENILKNSVITFEKLELK